MPGKKVTVTWGGRGNVTVTLFPEKERETPFPASMNEGMSHAD